MVNFNKEKFLNIGLVALSAVIIGGFVTTVALDLKNENPSDSLGVMYEKKLNEMAYDLTGAGITKTGPEMREYLFNKEVKNNPLKTNTRSDIEKIFYPGASGTESLDGKQKRVQLVEQLKEIGAFQDAKKFNVAMKIYNKEQKNDNANEAVLVNNISANIQKIRSKMTENTELNKKINL